MNEEIQTKLAIEIANKALRIATLEATNEHLEKEVKELKKTNQELLEILEQYTQPQTIAIAEKEGE